jgi:hypothetical protein
VEGRRSDISSAEAVTETEEESIEELLAVAVVTVVAAVVVVLMGIMVFSWPISKSSLMVDHCELIDEEDELRRIVCLELRIGGLVQIPVCEATTGRFGSRTRILSYSMRRYAQYATATATSRWGERTENRRRVRDGSKRILYSQTTQMANGSRKVAARRGVRGAGPRLIRSVALPKRAPSVNARQSSA